MRWIPFATIALFLTVPAQAAQEDLSADQLEARAERVVVAAVSSLETRWAGNGRGDLETVAWLSVEDTLAGEHEEAIALVLAGGHREDFGTWVPDEPTLLADRRYRLLLVHDDLGRWRILGGHAGVAALDLLPCYSFTGVDWTHQSHPVEEDFSLNVQSFPDGMASDEAVEQAYQRALDGWNHDGGARVYAPYGGHTTNSQYGSDNGVNVAMYTSSTWGSALAMATYSYMGGGQMSDCDIEFYGSNNGGGLSWHFDVNSSASAHAFDFTHVAMHELGHCLGLSHSNQGAAIMYAYSSPGSGEAARHLHSDDIAGLQAIYGVATVDLVVTDAWFETAGEFDDGDDVLDRDEVFELHVVLRNQGNGMAVDVLGFLKGSEGWVKVDPDPVPLGDLLAGSSSGTLADALVFPLTVLPGCDEDGSIELFVEIDDAAGNQWTTESWTLQYQCEGAHGGGDDDDDDDNRPHGGGVETGGSGCTCSAIAAGEAGGAAIGGLALLTALRSARRRRR